jgi:hypothetical protein
MPHLVSGHLVIWLIGQLNLAIWLSGYLVIWLSGYLAIWLIKWEIAGKSSGNSQNVAVNPQKGPPRRNGSGVENLSTLVELPARFTRWNMRPVQCEEQEARHRRSRAGYCRIAQDAIPIERASRDQAVRDESSEYGQRRSYTRIHGAIVNHRFRFCLGLN